MHLVSFEALETGAATSSHGQRPPEFEGNRPGGQRLGALLRVGSHAGAIVDLSRALALKLAADDVGAPEAEAESFLPHRMIHFLRRGESALRMASRTLSFVEEGLERFDAPDLLNGVLHDRREVHLLAPVPRPGKIVCVAQNYAEHAEEMGRGKAPPGEPALFIKASSAVMGPQDRIVLPKASRQVDYEGELGVVIGRTTKEVDASDALGCVAGYTVANDVTARDFQHVRGQRFLGKSCDTFAPMGPALVTADEIPDPQDLGLRTNLSGSVVQAARTKEMIFSVAEVIAFASKLMTLEPGDVILTGTPAGVGKARKPPRFLREGDVVEVEIERLGHLVNHVVS